MHIHPRLPSYVNHQAPPPIKTFEWDISAIEEACSRTDYQQIIENSDLFWLLFCKISSQIKHTDGVHFSISLEGKVLKILAQQHNLFKLQNFVEDIRQLFAKAYSEKVNFVALPIQSNYEHIIRKKSDIIDLSNWQDNNTLIYSLFKQFIQPCMQKICQSIGASCLDVVVTQALKYGNRVETQEIHAFKIDWLSEYHFVPPISLTPISPREDLQQSMYSMYKKQILCDFTLKAKDGSLQVHAIPLFTYGDEMMQRMLTSSMKESIDKTILFTEFSLNTVKAFIDFIYLGEKGLEPQSFLVKEIDLDELFEMAQTYQVKSLIDCCTNLYSVFCSIEHKEKIKTLADLYENKHLQTLYEYFSIKSDPNIIKI